MRREVLRRRLDDLYRHYDQRFLDPDPLEPVRRQRTPADREVVGLVASGLAFGNVIQIKRAVAHVLEAIGPRPAEAVASLGARTLARRLRGFRYRWLDGHDVACLLAFAGQMRSSHGSIEAFFAEGLAADAPDVGPALASFSRRALALDHEGLYATRRLPPRAGVRYFFPSPEGGSACKRLNLYLRWMARRGGVDLGVWRHPEPRQLVLPLDAHTHAIARRLRFTRYRSPGWAMALDVTRRLRRFDPEDPVKYDFALYRLDQWKEEERIRALEVARKTQRVSPRSCPLPRQPGAPAAGGPDEDAAGLRSCGARRRGGRRAPGASEKTARPR